MIILHSVKSLRTAFDARAAEWALAVATLNLGIAFTFNETMFADNPAAWGAMSAFADQETWAVVCSIIGGMRLLVLLINGAWWQTPHFRALTAFTSCFIWFRLAIDLIPNFSLGFALIPPVLMLDAYNSIRAGREAGVAHYLQRRKVTAKARAESADHVSSTDA